MVGGKEGLHIALHQSSVIMYRHDANMKNMMFLYVMRHGKEGQNGEILVGEARRAGSREGKRPTTGPQSPQKPVS